MTFPTAEDRYERLFWLIDNFSSLDKIQEIELGLIRDEILSEHEIVERLKGYLHFHAMQPASNNTAPIQDAIVDCLKSILENKQ